MAGQNRDMSMIESSEEDAILYDLSQMIEWEEEKEIVGGTMHDDFQSGMVTGSVRKMKSSISRWTWATVRAVGIPVGTGMPCLLPADLIKLVNSQESWLFSQSHDSRFVAILQDSCLEVRSSKEDYNTLVGRCTFSKDPHPQWRKVEWSLYSSTVAFSDSDGTVHVCDLKGILLFSFQERNIQGEEPFDCSSAICGLTFIGEEISKHKETGMHLLIVNYGGTATCLEINSGHEIGYKVAFKFDFSTCYPNGVSSVVYDKEHSLVIVGGCSGYRETFQSVPKATISGLTAWRVLSEAPHLKMLQVHSGENGQASNQGLFRRLSVMPSEIGQKFRGGPVDGVFMISLSPCGNLLAAIHLSGCLSLWDVPSFRKRRSWKREEQPHFDEIDPEASKSLNSSRRLKEYPLLHNVIDCKWWSDSSVILARCTGSLAVVSVSGNHLKNLFGEQCEWIEPAPRVTPCRGEGFLVLECETRVRTLKRQRTDTNEESTNAENEPDPFLEDSDNEETSRITGRLVGYAKSTVYDLTEIEYFRPPKKRARLVTKLYRLIGLTKTTPEKLFERKIEAEEYGEALALAQAYNLDCDRVFQRQWRKSPVSLATIQDYLAKISKRPWVLHECCERVPEDLDAARELLKFALCVTDVDKMAGPQRKKSTHLESSSELSDSDSDYEGFDVEEQRRQEIRRREMFVQTWINKIDFENLTLDQKEMIRARRKVLKYLDRLATYEHILGGYDAARERYNPSTFEEFRQRDMLTSAVEYARTCEWCSVETLLTFHGDELRDHRLPILSNFPKTLPPSEYKTLLPEVDEDGNVMPWPEESHRDTVDWCEQVQCRKAYMLSGQDNPSKEFYVENPQMKIFQTDSPTLELLRTWYQQQAVQMDLDARDIEAAIDILKFGMERGVDQLFDLLRDFKTLEMLVYECDYDAGLTLIQLQQKSRVDRIRMLMENSSTEMYLKNFHRWALPYLKACNEIEHGLAFKILKEYVTSIAEEDLTLPCLLLTNFIPDWSLPNNIADTNALIELTLEAVYLNRKPEQLDLVKQIHMCLAKASKTMVVKLSVEARSKIENLGRHVEGCSLLSKYNVKVTPSNIGEVEGDRQKVQRLFVRLSRMAGGREPPLSKTEWNMLLTDMLQLRERIFAKTCSIESAVCLEVFIESLLTSGNIANLQIAAERMMRSAEEEHDASRHFLYNTPKKLSYESSVALVIKSSQEYFDASTPKSNDNMLSIARECLLLIIDRPPLIREKLDLIEGVILLHHFGVDKLPLQVRLSENRMDLIEKALNVDKQAYKKTEPLLRLSMLLRVCGSKKTERKGRILIMIINKALEFGDYQSAFCLCQELIDMSYGPAWSVCLKLAMEEDFDDVVGKRDILAYAACHCDPDRLSEAMDQMCLLNTIILGKAIQEQGDIQAKDAAVTKMEDELDTNTPHQDGVLNYPDHGNRISNPLDKIMMTTSHFLSPVKMMQSTAKGTKAVWSATGTVLSATTHTTKAMLSNVGDSRWWRSTIDQTLSVLPSSDEQGVEDEHIQDTVSNDDFEFQGCPLFYADAIKNSICRHGLNLDTIMYTIPHEIDLNQAKFRFLSLSKMSPTDLALLDLTETDILNELVSQVLPYDFGLGISYLLTYAEVRDAYDCLQHLPMSSLSIQISLYHFSLRFLALVADDMLKSQQSSIYQIDPLKLMERVVSIVSVDTGKGDQMKFIASYLLTLKEQLFDFAQGEKLQQLGRGIDLNRFTKDTDYREETILGLAMTSDEEQYKLAVSLAHRSKTDIWLVLVTHLEYLFTECQDDLDSITLHDRIKKLNMVPELVTRPVAFFERMDTHVYPLIRGDDHDRLHLYFSLLNECKLESENLVSAHNICIILPSNHIKMLKKVKSMTPTLNYKDLITDDHSSDSPGRILSILSPLLNASNIQMFSKMVPKIPYSSHQITSSSLYLQVAKGIIWRDVSLETKGVDWLHRYESCNSHLRMLNPTDLLLFFREIFFVSPFSNLISIKEKQDVIKRAVKLCKMQGTKERKKQLDEEVLGKDGTFQTVLPLLIQMSKHLDTYSMNFVSDMVKASGENPQMKNYLKIYDEGLVNSQSFLDLASLMLCDGHSPSYVQNYLAIVPGKKISPQEVLKHSIDEIIEKFRNEGWENIDAFQMLHSLVHNINIHEKEKGKVMTSKQVIELLRPFCDDKDTDVKLRVDILKLLENQFSLEESEAKLLLYHRTCAIVNDGWGDEGVQILTTFGDDETQAVSSEDNRIVIFKQLLVPSENDIMKLKHLIDLLDMWPEFDDVNKQRCWMKVLLGMTEHGVEGGKEIVDVIRNKRSEFALETVGAVFEKLWQDELSLAAFKVVLLTDVDHFREQFLVALKSIKRMGPSQCDEELLCLMLETGVAVETVSTVYYPSIAEFLLSGNCPDAAVHVRKLARQLQDQGHMPEAGALLMNFRGTHPALRTFSNAMSSLSRWLHS